MRTALKLMTLIVFRRLKVKNRRTYGMALLKSFTKEVFIRLEVDAAFVSTVRYGCFHSKTKEFPLEWEGPSLTLQESAPVRHEYLVPPVTAPLTRRGSV
jgi:hypothetical protein